MIPEPSPTPSTTPEPFTPETPLATPETSLSPKSEMPEAEPLVPEAPIVVQPKASKPTGKLVSPDTEMQPSGKTLSGQERLRQLGQKFGQYRSHPRQETAIPTKSLPPADGDHSNMTPDGAASPMPNVSIPEPLPPTLPEILDSTP